MILLTQDAYQGINWQANVMQHMYEPAPTHGCSLLFSENILLAKHPSKVIKSTAKLQISVGYFQVSDSVESDRK